MVIQEKDLAAGQLYLIQLTDEGRIRRGPARDVVWQNGWIVAKFDKVYNAPIFNLLFDVFSLGQRKFYCLGLYFHDILEIKLISPEEIEAYQATVKEALKSYYQRLVKGFQDFLMD
ncbi:MAG: hypothetical protein Q7K65_01880 [Candidatus Buchananbacteria bacterium]|nr:hypothetical protein [Candidatus Buchananbacteria bacterium]